MTIHDPEFTAPPDPPVRRYRSRPRRPSTRGLMARIAAVSAAATLAIGGLIAVRMASGEDPALGPKAAVPTPTSHASVTSSPAPVVTSSS